MGMTMTQKLLARAAGREKVEAGELIECPLDLVFGNDITAPIAIKEMERIGVEKVFDGSKVALIPDHLTPNRDIAAAEQCKTMREFAKRAGVKHYYEIGRSGIEHAFIPEIGLVAPGDIVIGADSHTCTYGALGAFSTGVGSTDMAAGMATGVAWFKVPSAICVKLTGKLGKYVTGKDVILELIGKIGVDGARYQSIEFTGDGVSSISMDGRFSIANMAVEAGAKNGIFPVDDVVREYVKDRVKKQWAAVEPDPDAEYTRTIEIDLSKVPLNVALPHLPENVKPAAEVSVPVDQVVIGSCTNGRMEDMRMAAELLKGKKVHDNVRCLVFPATQAIYKQCIREGIIDIFVDAGAVVAMPTCGPCLGGHCGILAEGEAAVATTNRNFIGRMGHTSSKVYLAGPAVAAASAVAGHITTPDAL